MINNTNTKFDLEFKGPYLLSENNKKFFVRNSELKSSGLYLFTFEYNNRYLIWFDGFSTKNVYNRLNSHMKNILCGSYSTLDIRSANLGKRKEIWEGFYFKKDYKKQQLFLKQKDILLPFIFEMLRGLRIFYASLNEDRRILARIEAAIMNTLYNEQNFVSEFPDKGMHLEPKYNAEKAFKVSILEGEKFYGLSNSFDA